MGITLCSIFRNSEDYIDRYFLQIYNLERVLGEPIRLVIAEGDSADDTYEQLEKHLVDHAEGDLLLKIDHGEIGRAHV